CSFCASAGAAIAVLPSTASTIPMCLPIIDFPPLMGQTARARSANLMAELYPHLESECARELSRTRAATQPLRRQAWLRIFVVRCSLPCDPPVGGHSCNGGMIPRFRRLVCD